MLAIIPIGRISVRISDYLQQYTAEIFKTKVKVLPRIRVSLKARNSLRKQYNANTILEIILAGFKRKNFEKILVVIDKDLYVPELNFIFGMVEKIGGRKGIISVTRLREEFYCRPKDEILFFERVLKEAVHEIGHLCGISHCGNPRCVMYYSNGVWDTDAKDHNFCYACRESLNAKTSLNVCSLSDRRL
ncbi:MAG: archaemetzincin family Zn-dependent metalloprotease [Candidatus Omnitrophota bacterium]